MAIEVEIDVELLKSEIKKTYASVSEQPEKEFIFPTGRAWAEDLNYPDELANVPDAAVESFAGVANPWTMGRLAEGERVLDLGSGAGTDSLIAAQMVGEHGNNRTNASRTRRRAAVGVSHPQRRAVAPCASSGARVAVIGPVQIVRRGVNSSQVAEPRIGPRTNLHPPNASLGNMYLQRSHRPPGVEASR